MNCPNCGKKIDLRVARAEGEWREIIELLPVFGKHGNIVFEYVQLFAVNPLRIKTAKVLRLFKDIAKLLKVGKFVYRKKEYSISVAGIVEGLEIVCNKDLDSSQENHNYLKKVMIGISERERKGERDRLDREQRKREKTEDRRQKTEDSGRITAEEYKAKQGLKSLAEKIGNAD